MTGPSFVLYKQFIGEEKDAAFFDQSITTIRRDWRRIVQSDRAYEAKKILLSQQSMQKIIDSFDDEDFKRCNNFDPLPIWENILNTLIEEITQAPPKCEIFATDPSAIDAKQKDLNLLKNRKLIEIPLSQAQKAVGAPPQFKLPSDTYNSNVKEFDGMGLNENDPDDINFFSQNYHRLWYELGAQSIVDNTFKINRFDQDMIEPLTIDALAHKVTCLDCYVDRMTGAIKHRYLYPEECFVIPGNSNDGHDDIAKGWETMVTLSEWIEMVGDNFVFERDWRMLLMALNFSNTSFRYTGFTRNGTNYDCCGNPQWESELAGCRAEGHNGKWESGLCDWTQAYTYKVYVGKAQWPVVEATTTYLQKYGKGGPTPYKIVPYNYQLSKMEMEQQYEKESLYQQQVYESYYLATTAISQWIFNYSKVYYMVTEGVNDEYAFGSMIFYRKRGKPAAILSEPYIDIANFAFYKMKFAIYKAKMNSDIFHMEEVVEVAKYIDRMNTNDNVNVAGKNFQGIMEQIMQMEKTKSIKLRATPRVDGAPAPMAPSDDVKHNGLDPVAISMQTCIQWAIQQITTQVIGINDLRLGQQQNEREGYKLNMAETENSLKSTGYIYRMIQYCKERLATYTLNYAQDIVKFEDSIPYKWIQRIVGDEAFDQIKMLKDFAAHRYGMFVRDRNNQMEKQMLLQAAGVSLQQKEITLNQYYIVISTEDHKKAFKLLDFIKMKEAKKLRKQQIQDQQIQDEMAQREHQRQMELLQAQTQGKMDIEKEITARDVRVANIQAGAKVQVKEITVQSEGPKQEDKSEGARALAREKANLEQQSAYAK